MLNRQIIPLLVGVTLLSFFWGLAKFIRAAGDEKKITEGKEFMKWGIVGLFVMVSIWGLVNLFYRDVFGTSLAIPKFRTR